LTVIAYIKATHVIISTGIDKAMLFTYEKYILYVKCDVSENMLLKNLLNLRNLLTKSSWSFS